MVVNVTVDLVILIYVISLMFNTRSFLLVSHYTIATFVRFFIVRMFVMHVLFQCKSSCKFHVTLIADEESQLFMDTPFVILEMRRCSKCFITLFTFKWFNFLMNSFMCSQITFLSESPITIHAPEFSFMLNHMYFKNTPICKFLTTFLAFRLRII